MESGALIDVQGHISRAGDGEVRHPLYEAANHADALPGLLQPEGGGLKLAKKRGHKRACVAGSNRCHASKKAITFFPPLSALSRSTDFPRRRSGSTKECCAVGARWLVCAAMIAAKRRSSRG
jgi:hypothetical protein